MTSKLKFIPDLVQRTKKSYSLHTNMNAIKKIENVERKKSNIFQKGGNFEALAYIDFYAFNQTPDFDNELKK